MESREIVPNNLFAGQQWRKRHREQTYGHGERGGEGEMYGESDMETYITICKIDSQWEFAVCLRKLKQRLCINLEGWDGSRDGREVQEGGDICIYTYDMPVEVCQKTAKFCKAIILQLKNKFKNPFIYVHKNKRKYCIVKQK